MTASIPNNAADPPEAIELSYHDLPSREEEIFLESSFFTHAHADKERRLPSPNEIRKQAHLDGNQDCEWRPRPVCFPALGLLVKFGASITIREGQCLWAVRRYLPHVPVPEVYAWRRDGEQMFIYQQLMDGVTLCERWESLTRDERVLICAQLREAVSELRRLRQDPRDCFTGTISRTPLQDAMFDGFESGGPFSSVRDFNTWWARVVHRIKPGVEEYNNPMRHLLPDNDAIRFTHADLNPLNIIVSPLQAGIPQLRALVDWHQSGWYPAYWEHAKMLWTVHPREEWATLYVPRVLETPDGLEGWQFHMEVLGC